MNIVSYKNQKTFIFLSQKENFVLATLVTDNKVVSVRKITEAQKTELLSNAHSFESRNIFIIDRTTEALFLLESLAKENRHVAGKAIPSPYFLNLYSSELALSTQKTRGPNK